MPSGKVRVILEVRKAQPAAFALHMAAATSERAALASSEELVRDLAGYGLEVLPVPPVPLFSEKTVSQGTPKWKVSPQLVGFERARERFGEPTELRGFAAFATPEENEDVEAETVVLGAEIAAAALDKVASAAGVTVWPNSELTYLACGCGGVTAADVLDGTPALAHPFDLASSSGGVDCRPFRPGVDVQTIRALLGVESVWKDGFRGQNVVVGIIDEGVNGSVYPVVGGYDAPEWPRQPGTAPVTSHGSMCAADILVAAPSAKLYDYAFLGVPDSLGALRMFQAVLESRRKNGTPQLTNNSYGFVGVPDRDRYPNHEVWDVNHPLHRKVREVVASGAPAFFAAGNCGANCPSGVCRSNGIGAGHSIHGANALREVITVAAVNSRHERIGYSSQGPSLDAPGFAQCKPDLAAYSHFFGNFGPGRPGGETAPFDNGTSAATPVAAGVAALLLSAFPLLPPDALKRGLIRSAVDIGVPGYDHDLGFGVMSAATAYACLKDPERFPTRSNLRGERY